MSESRAATPVEAASGHLLASKLFVPRPQPGYVPRDRLADRLDEGLERGVVLVCAAAGSGKTGVVAEWSRRRDRRVAWVSLDPDDNDAARFWRHVVAALGRLRPGLAERVEPLLAPPAPVAFDGLVTAVANELAAQPDDVVLVVDDYHVIAAEPVHASVAFLLEHLPPQLRVVLTSRSDPPLGVARLRARGRLAELRAADLRFTEDEATALLSQAAGQDLPAGAVAALVARTEGWATGLQLAGLSLRGETDVAGFVARFDGSHRYVLDYLSEEVLAQQPEQVTQFLLATSVLRRLSGPLCDAVTGRRDSQAVLEGIEDAGLFLAPLDDVRGWWAYHGLFADVLRARLQRQQPGRAPRLHRAAAAWFDEHGYADDAVHHALAARDHGWAARLVERHADALLLRSRGATVQRWLAALPAEVLAARPRALLADARLALLGGRSHRAREALDAAERALAADRSGEPYEPAVAGGASLVANVPATIALDRAYLALLDGDVATATASLSRAGDAIGDDEWMLRSHADGYLALADLLAGRLDAAEQRLTATIATWRSAAEASLAVRGCHHLGQVRRAQGRLDAAVDAYRQALDIAAPAGRPPLPAAGLAHVGLAEVAYERDDLDAALAHLDAGLGLCRQLAYTQPLATGLATLAAVRQARGEADGAAAALAHAERVPRDAAVTSVLDPVPARRARLLLARGDVAAAARWVTQQGLAVDDAPRYPREAELLVAARVLLAQERPREALALAERLLGVAAAQQRLGSVIEVGAVRALALAASGADAAAVAALSETLALACPRGYVRVFADEGAPMAALLGRVLAAQGGSGPAGAIGFDCLARLQRAFAAAAPSPRSTATSEAATAAGLVEPLTPREHEVLALLAEGRTNAEVAGALFVTLDTVKKHVSHVLDKLGAGNRTEAVARARGLGLLDR